MARTVGKIAQTISPIHQFLGKNTALRKYNYGLNLAEKAANGEPINGRTFLDPAHAILQEPPKPPAPPPVFPDVEGAALNARRRVRRSAAGGGVGSTILTGGYSPTGQAAAVLGSG